MTAAPVAQPVAGPTFRKPARLPVDGAKRRKLLCLIAAYADAGETSPPMTQLAERLGLEPVLIDVLLDKLTKDGWLTVKWANIGRPGQRHGRRRNRYAIRFDNGKQAAA